MVIAIKPAWMDLHMIDLIFKMVSLSLVVCGQYLSSYLNLPLWIY